MRQRALLNRIIELHDSTVAAIVERDDALVVELRPAYMHSSEGRPGIDSGKGWTQDADLVIYDFDSVPLVAELPAWISEGELSIGADCYPNVIPIPLNRTRGEVRLDLVLVTAESLSIRGRQIELRLLGEAQFVQNFR